MNNKKVDKKREQRILYEHEGWVKGYEEGMEARKDEIQALQAVLEIKNATIKALSGKSPIKDSKDALDLAWELAYPVKEGQTIPRGTKYLERHNGALREYTAFHDMNPKAGEGELIRSQDPLPDSVPDWLDAPAVLANVDAHDEFGERIKGVFYQVYDNRWTTDGTEWTFHWNELHEVTPLWPREDA